MALLGPIVVVAESSAADLLDVLRKAGAFPIVETRWADAPAAIGEIQPVALAIADARGTPSPQHVGAVIQCIETRGGPVTPVIALVENNSSPVIPSALPIALDDSTDRLIARLRCALRIRTLHATVLRRSRAADAKKRAPAFLPPDLLDDATVLCVGRGGSYPALSVAIGERVGLIGALSIETAARYLNARDVDGIVIGEGLGPRVVAALLTMLAENARFRDLPVGVLDNSAVDDERLPNLVRVEADPARLVERVLPFVRLQAFEAQLTRVLKSLESEGVIDPDTGLLAAQAFWRDLGRRARERGDRWRAFGRTLYLRRRRRSSRLRRCRATFQPPRAQRRFCLPGAGRIDPRGFYQDRSAQRPSGCTPDRKRAEAHHALPRP